MNDLKPWQMNDDRQRESCQQRICRLNKVTPPLPPDPERMNDVRASRADQALQHFRRLTQTNHEDALGDLLCDLMHWSDRNNFDFNLALQRAEGHYEDEAETVSEFQSSAIRDLT